jgi:hypothetical protein
MRSVCALSTAAQCLRSGVVMRCVHDRPNGGLTLRPEAGDTLRSALWHTALVVRNTQRTQV